MTSMPTKVRPSSRRRGPMAAQISRSRAVISGGFRAAADMHVGARLAGRRHPVDDAGRLALDQDDALVALAHLGQVALDDEGLAEGALEHFEQRDQVLVMAGDAEDAGAAVAVERLDDDVAVLLAEGGDAAAVAGDQGRRVELGELGDAAASPARCAR